MIPLKLQLKNFLSYGDSWTTINFEPYQFICLSGKNGHGKSALLDAMTWALWGQARKVSGVPRADDALVHLGQRHMAVVLDFSCHEQRYVVRRELILYQDKPKLVLDFGIVDMQAKRTKSLTEKTIRLTQMRVQEIIGLDFDSFTNSIFLRQGQSNEFSKKTAQERKQILASILGIDQYEHMRKGALERMRALELEKNGNKQLQVHLSSEYARINDVKRNVTECEQACIALAVDEQEFGKRRQLLQERKIKIIEQKNALAVAQRELDDAKVALQIYSNQQQLTLSCSCQERELVLAAKRAELKSLVQKRDYCQSRSRALECSCAELHEQQKGLERMLTAQKEIQERFVGAQKLFDKRKDVYQRMLAHGNWVHSELKVLKQQQKITDCLDEARCPLCQQILSCDHQERLKKQLAERAKFFELRMDRVGGFVQKNKQQLLDEHLLVKNYEEQLQQLGQIGVRLDELCKRDEQIVQELAVVRSEIGSYDIAYEHEDRQMETLQKELEEIKINITAQLVQDEEYKQLKQQLELCETNVRTLSQADILHDEAVIGEQEKNLIREMDQLVIRKNMLMEQKGRLMQDLDHLESVRVACAKHVLSFTALEEELADYELMAQALGKDGVQALLIESVIPEIEDEANYILSRLSDQQARVFIESLRDLKSGGTRETLDIKIADVVGIRPYELFSGGEAFRIDFALRIAISKLLARRAGASLQALVIDEGFGSQDEDGLALIVDMLYKIQDYFAKIIIVSHLPFLKDQVPVQFLVEKCANGSTVRVIEQG